MTPFVGIGLQSHGGGRAAHSRSRESYAPTRTVDELHSGVLVVLVPRRCCLARATGAMFKGFVDEWASALDQVLTAEGTCSPNPLRFSDRTKPLVERVLRSLRSFHSEEVRITLPLMSRQQLGAAGRQMKCHLLSLLDQKRLIAPVRRISSFESFSAPTRSPKWCPTLPASGGWR